MIDKKLLKSVSAAFLGQLLYIVLGLIGNIFLARLLSPHEIGQVGLVMVFISVSNIFVESGFGGALVQRLQVGEKEYSTIFIFNLLVSILMSVGIYCFSNSIANYYNNEELEYILKALSIIPIFNSFQITSNSKMVREMKFKRRATYKFISLFLGTSIAVGLAYLNYGVWAIVSLYVFTSFFLSLMLIIKERTFKRLIFDKTAFKELYSFGVNTASTNVINTFFNNIYQLILGKYFNLTTVGYFYQAKRLQDVSDTLFQIVLSNVFFSYLAKLQNDITAFKVEYYKIVKLVLIITSFTVSLLFLYAEEVIIILYGEKWIKASFFLQVLALSSFFYLQELVNKNIFKVFNKTQIILKLEIFKKIIQLITIAIGILYQSIELLLYGYLITSILSYYINYYISRKVISGFSKKELIYVIKIIGITVISTCLILVSFNIFNITGFYKIIFLPIFVFAQALLLQIFRLLDIKAYKNFI